MSEKEAGELATLAGATEGVITGTFSLLGAGGLESVGEQLVGTAARQAIRASSKSFARTYGEKLLKGITAEQFEEGMIAAFDSATVQARINPNMTVEDFQNTLRETALVTLAVSGPTIGIGSLRETLAEKASYQKTDDELELEADLNLADAALRDRVRREGGVGTPLGERLRRQATQPGAANLPPTRQAPPNAPQDGGAPAPGAPSLVAPGGTPPVAPAQGPTGAPAGVPGVQPAGAAEPVLVPADSEVNNAPEVSITFEGGMPKGDLVDTLELIGEGSEHTVYRDGDSVVKIAEPYNDKSDETFVARIETAARIDSVLGDGTLEVVGFYRSPNGTKNPIYRQAFVSGQPATRCATHLSPTCSKTGLISGWCRC
jgi:hypothetical protein